MTDTPETFARHLAQTIESPLAIEEQTLRQFGRAPTLRRIADMRYAVEQRLKAQPVRAYDGGGTKYTPATVDAPKAIKARAIVSWRDVVEASAEIAGLSYDDVIGKGRRFEVVSARAVATTILRERGLTYPQIGRMLGGRDHSTIMHAHKSFPDRARAHPQIGKMVSTIRALMTPTDRSAEA